MGIWVDHHPRLSTTYRPIVNQYREGKVKRTPLRGVKKFLKPDAYKQSEPPMFFGTGGVTAYLLYNGSTTWSHEQA